MKMISTSYNYIHRSRHKRWVDQEASQDMWCYTCITYMCSVRLPDSWCSFTFLFLLFFFFCSVPSQHIQCTQAVRANVQNNLKCPLVTRTLLQYMVTSFWQWGSHIKKGPAVLPSVQVLCSPAESVWYTSSTTVCLWVLGWLTVHSKNTSLCAPGSSNKLQRKLSGRKIPTHYTSVQ